MEQETQEVFDVIGVGIGPFNLSVAALLDPIDSLSSCFLEARPEFQWHPGLMLPEATLQVSYLKDLVTLADPTNPYSFLSFLFKQKRFYRFLHADFQRVTRKEYNQYLQWVCPQLSMLRFGCSVSAITLEDGLFRVVTDKSVLHAKNIILGTGLDPSIPSTAQSHLGPTVYHSNEFLMHDSRFAGKQVAVIGGGQSGAEVVLYMLSMRESAPEKVSWISRRLNFLPLDESSFTNEFFTPSYASYFFNLDLADRRRILSEQKLASDGISSSVLKQLYQKLYTLEFFDGKCDSFCLLPHRELTTLRPDQDGWNIHLENQALGNKEVVDADIVILCTGYKATLPYYLEPLRAEGMLPWGDHGFELYPDFSIKWDGPQGRQIYVQNRARHTHGIADPNLSLMAWRSATIINSLMGTCIYDVPEGQSLIEWSTPEGVSLEEIPDSRSLR